MKVLFVCTGNTCRSPMAEVLARSIIGDRGWETASAGVWVGAATPPSPNAVAALAALSLEAGSHLSRQLDADAIATADAVVAMTQAHKAALLEQYPDACDRTFTLAELAGEGGDVPDPYGGSLSDYRDTARDLLRRLPLALRTLGLAELQAPEGGDVRR